MSIFIFSIRFIHICTLWLDFRSVTEEFVPQHLKGIQSIAKGRKAEREREWELISKAGCNELEPCGLSAILHLVPEAVCLKLLSLCSER